MGMSVISTEGRNPVAEIHLSSFGMTAALNLAF